MEKGSYKSRKIDFNQYTVTKFSPHLFNIRYETLMGCGANALAMITGHNPVYIDNKPKKGCSKDDWRDDFMLSYLKKYGYKTIPITVASVTRSNSYIESPITESHVLLVSQHLMKTEATWSVFYKDYIFHNFSISQLKPREFVNNPILTAYIVFSDDWRK